MKPFPPKSIAVAIDLSGPSLTALETAKGLARRWKSHLDLLYVFEYPPAYGFGGEETLVLRSQWEEHSKWIRKELSSRMLDFPKKQYTVHALEGSASLVLERWSKKRSTGMLVTGTHGYTGVQHALYGSVAEAIVRTSQAPVITVHENKPLTVPNRVLLPFNQARYAEPALLAGFEWCRKFDAEAIIFQAIEDPGDEVATYVQLKARVAALLGKKKLTHHIVVRTGDPQRSILEEARFGKHDLLIMAGHRKPFWEDLVLGTTAERVLRHCTIPVLCFPSDAKSGTKKANKKV